MKIERTRPKDKLERFFERKRGLVYVFTGDGEGKTAAALGLGLRAIGHGKNVVLIQFMKGRKSVGEYQVQDVLKNYEVYQFGKEEFVDLYHLDKDDQRLAKEGLEFAKEKIKEMPDVLILDEINLMMDVDLIEIEKVLALIKELPKNMVLILTGRNAPKSIIKAADIVSEIKNVKHMFNYDVFRKERIEKI